MNARIAMLLVLALPLAARAEFTGKVIKIGVLNDQSGLYADLAGQGSVTARTSRTSARTSRASGSTWTAWT